MAMVPIEAQAVSLPYDPNDGREDLAGDEARVLRGGSFYYSSWSARCACRYAIIPEAHIDNFGFRVVMSP